MSELVSLNGHLLQTGVLAHLLRRATGMRAIWLHICEPVVGCESAPRFGEACGSTSGKSEPRPSMGVFWQRCHFARLAVRERPMPGPSHLLVELVWSRPRLPG